MFEWLNFARCVYIDIKGDTSFYNFNIIMEISLCLNFPSCLSNRSTNHLEVYDNFVNQSNESRIEVAMTWTTMTTESATGHWAWLLFNEVLLRGAKITNERKHS